MLAACVALDRAGIHEVVPTAENKTWHIHLVEMARGVFHLPVFIVGGVLKYGMNQVEGVFGISGLLERHLPRRSSSAIAEMEQALACIGHVLRDEIWRLGDSEKILSVAGLGASERSDLSIRPGLLGQPRHRVIAVPALTPSQVTVADVLPLR